MMTAHGGAVRRMDNVVTDFIVEELMRVFGEWGAEG